MSLKEYVTKYFTEETIDLNSEGFKDKIADIFFDLTQEFSKLLETQPLDMALSEVNAKWTDICDAASKQYDGLILDKNAFVHSLVLVVPTLRRFLSPKNPLYEHATMDNNLDVAQKN